MDAMAEIRQTFFEECADGLRELDTALAALAKNETEPDTANVAFRAVHSIKGGAASFSLSDLSHFAHLFEVALDELRSKRAEPTPEFLGVATRAAQVLRDLTDAAKNDTLPDERRMLDMVEELKPLTGEKGAGIARYWSGEEIVESDDGMEGLEFTPVGIDFADILGSVPESVFRVTFRPMPELYQNANEASRLIRDCLALGTGTVSCDTSELPAFADMDPEGAYLIWTIELMTRANEQGVREVFEFAEWDCELTVELCEDVGEAGDPAIDAAFASLLLQIQSGSNASSFEPEPEEEREDA